MMKNSFLNVGNLDILQNHVVQASRSRHQLLHRLNRATEEQSSLIASASDTGITDENFANFHNFSASQGLPKWSSCPDITTAGDSSTNSNQQNCKKVFTENTLIDLLKLYREKQSTVMRNSSAISQPRGNDSALAFNSPRNMAESDDLFVPAYSVGYTTDSAKMSCQKVPDCTGPIDYNERSKAKTSEDVIVSSLKIRKTHHDQDRNWQCSKSSVKERLSYMFNNNLMADVHFIMSYGHESTDESIVIPAHQFVLSISSSVFDAMFNGQLANRTEEHLTIKITDIEPAAFLNLLRFFYTDQVTLCPETVMATLYAAKKYAATLLEFACVDYLKKNLTGENACMLLAQARLFDEPQLATLCLEVIDHSTMEAVSAESFSEIDRETLCTILQRDSLEIREFNLYLAAVKWAQAECVRHNIQSTPDNQRKLLDKALGLIRFPLMSVEEFASCPAQSGLLSDREVVQMFLYFTAKPRPSVPFLDVARCCPTGKEESVCRFGKIEKRWGYSGHTDRIRFMVNRKVYIIGFGLYGSIHASAKYFANIQLLNSDLRIVLGENDVIYTTDGTSVTVKVAFREPIEILPHVSYTACATIQGPDSYYGSKGVRKVVSGKSTFQFFYNAGNNNGTSVEDGQLPEIYYYT